MHSDSQNFQQQFMTKPFFQTWESRSKSDDTPVTKADIMADELIRTRLISAYPDIPM